jgi:hypothetical protein
MRYGPEHDSPVINLGLSEHALHGSPNLRGTTTGISSVAVVVSSVLPQSQDTGLPPPAAVSSTRASDGGLLSLEYLSKSTLLAVRKHVDGLCAAGANISNPLARDDTIGSVSRMLLRVVKHLVACGTGEGEEVVASFTRNQSIHEIQTGRAC